MHRSLAEEAQVIQTIHISDTASRIDHREKLQLNDSLKKKLSTNIEKTYQAHLDEAIEKVHQTDLVIPGQRIRHFTISWKQQTYHSEILFEIDNQRYVATYTCTFEIPEALQSAELICTG